MTLRLLLSVFVLSTVLATSMGAPEPFDPARAHTNGLEMHFVPVPGTKVLFSVYQTRLKDFRAFVREAGYAHMSETADADSRMWSMDNDGNKQRGHSWENPGFKQTEDDPVVGVSWYDARYFCEWLTSRERAAGRLPNEWEYRLPTDVEWSVAVGLLDEDPKKTPEEKHEKIKERYPWGKNWPPPPGAGNYAGAEAVDDHWPTKVGTIPGYKDGYARTAPVGSFKANMHGIFDLGGNIIEWCEDEYRPGAGLRVLRGAAWRAWESAFVLSSHRTGDRPARRYDCFGFRCVAAPSSP